MQQRLAALTAADQAQKQTISQLERQAKEQRESISTLTREKTALVKQRDNYVSIFRRHDLTKLSRARPGLIEPRINNGTDDVFRDLEKTTKEQENESP